MALFDVLACVISRVDVGFFFWRTSMSGRLRDLIRSVRACKTAAEERSVLQRESAFVRQQLAAGNNRGTCMLKLMYMTMLGYATEFGQMEVIKLLAESDFASKRIGYLTLCVLMDEHQEVLTLAENHMKRDLNNNSNPYVQCLVLDTIANIAGEDMSRDMVNDVLALCASSNTNLKKKAALAAQRAVRKAPELVDVFLEDERLMSIFSERNHGVLLCNISLINACLGLPNGKQYCKRYAALIPGAVRHLSGLVLSAFANEYEISGIADPFLQVKLLEFLRHVGSDSEDCAEAMNNVLAQTATNTSMDRNVGSAVLYECVKTILSIRCDSSLRMLAYNILARFMDRDNNCRFAALSTFLQVVQTDKSVAQRHRATVLDCLKDVDTSIRRRALQLTVALVDESNVRLMATDLLSYLVVCADELKEETSDQLCRVIDERSPTDEWQVEMSLKLFRSPHAKIPLSFGMNFVGLVSRTDAELKTRATKMLWDELQSATQDHVSLKYRTAFLISAIWTIGEYCNTVCGSVTDAEKVMGVLSTLIADCAAAEVKQYSINAVMKVASHYPATIALANGIFDSVSDSTNIELQQRAAEYRALLNLDTETLSYCFSPGGPLSLVPSDSDVLELKVSSGVASPSTASQPQPAASNRSTGVDLESLFAAPAAASAKPTTAGGDVLSSIVPLSAWDDIFSAIPSAIPSSAAQQPAAPSAVPANSVSLVPGAPTPPLPSTSPSPVRIVVHQSPDIIVSVSATPRSESNELGVTLFVTSRGSALSGVTLSVAVPKTQSLEMSPAATDAIPPNGSLEQRMIVRGPSPPTRLSMLVKVSYVLRAEQRTTELRIAQDLPLM